MGLSANDMLALLDARLSGGNGAMPPGTEHLPQPVDWHALFARDSTPEWLVIDVWPMGRQVHMHAARKTGKSLVALWIACNLAVGRDAFTKEPVKSIKVAYLDYEMTEDDLLERVDDMGFTPDQLEGRLFYYLHPAIPALDTAKGGAMLLETLQAHGCEAVVIDTMSRVISGEENSNDTYIKFYAHTGKLLKEHNVSMFRLDHEGHESGRSRGASAKADDVDLVWQLKRMEEDDLQLIRMASRVSWVPEKVTLAQGDTLGYRRVEDTWPPGTKEKARELDLANVPLNATRRQAASMLATMGFKQGKATVLSSALKYRERTFPVTP